HAKPAGQCFLCFWVIKKRDPDTLLEPSHLAQVAAADNAASDCWIEHRLPTCSMSGAVGKCFYIHWSVESTFVVNSDLLCFITASIPNNGGTTDDDASNRHRCRCRYKDSEFLGIKHRDISFQRIHKSQGTELFRKGVKQVTYLV